MLLNLVTTTLRALRRHVGYTLANWTGLTVGVAACLLIGLYVHHEWTYDVFHDTSDRVVRIVETFETERGTDRVVGTAAPVGPALANGVPGVETATRLARFGRVAVTVGDKQRYSGDYVLTDPAFADVFDFGVAHGDLRASLSEPNAIVLTDETARFYFGRADVVGEVVSVEAFGDLTVGAVLKPLPSNSHLQFGLLIPFAHASRVVGFWDPVTSDWTPQGRGFATYLLPEPDVSLASIEDALAALHARRYTNVSEDVPVPDAMTLQPLTDIHLSSSDLQGTFAAGTGRPAYLWGLIAIAAFILGIGVINYVNLATARATERAEEIGVRKTVGATAPQLTQQFLVESFVLCSLAFGGGLLLALGAEPVFTTLTGVSPAFDVLATPASIASLGGALVLVALAAGGYPAFVLSRFAPTRALGSHGTTRVGGNLWLRRGLVGVQFVLSIGLILATLTVHRQLNYVQSKPLGFQHEHMVVVDINSSNVRENIQALRAEIQRHPGVDGVSVTSRVPNDWKTLPEVDVRVPESSSAQTAPFMSVDPAFHDTYDVRLVRGRGFDAGRPADTSAVMLNRAAVQALGWDDPVGRTLRVSGFGKSVSLRVIGVVEDFHFESLYAPIRPIVLGHWRGPLDEMDYITVRASSASMQPVIDHVRGIGQTFDPNRPFEYNVLDQRIAAQYRADVRAGQLFGVAAGLAVVIACIGLVGLVAYSVARRRREIGIRKVLGATATSIIGLFAREYVALVAAAFVVGAPLAYLTMQSWLDTFAYQSDVGIGMYALAGAVAVGLAVSSVAVQALRAAQENPAEVVRSE